MTDGAPPEIEPGLTYADALAELDTILAQLDRSEVDVDTLAARVARGAVLIKFCRDRLQSVRTDVDAVVGDLLDDPAGNNGGTP